MAKVTANDPTVVVTLSSLVSLSKKLRWRVRDDSTVFNDGDTLLVAVPLANDAYAYSVIVIDCDDDRFDVKCEGESWGWSWDDVSHYLKLPLKPLDETE